MMLTTLLPGITGVLYFITAVAFLFQNRAGFALTYFAYALANIGLIWASLDISNVR